MTGLGAHLAERLYEAEVRPLLDRAAPGLRHLAGLLGTGSEVLGLDDTRSLDHDFGCRMTLLVDDVDTGAVDRLDALLAEELPADVDGWPVRFPTAADPRTRHRVEVAGVHAFARSRLGVEVGRPLDVVAWLSVPGQSVLEVVRGPVFHDDTTSFTLLADQISWYPHDVWLYLLCSAWVRLDQELPFVGRTGERGDDLGSRLLAARLAGHLRHLAFLLERRWSPYPKWAGPALRALPTGAALEPLLAACLRGGRWEERETALATAAELLGARQDELGLPTGRPVIQPFHDRPFVSVSPAVCSTLEDAVRDPVVRALPRGVGCMEQWCDNVDLLAHPERRQAVQALYRELLAGSV